MDALISGCTGRALLVDRDSLTSFDVDDPSELVPRAAADFAYIFGEMQDLRVLENTDIESVRQELKHDSDSILALDLVLISLDAELPDEIRKEAIQGLDELLAESRLAERLENILYARPLPEDSDLKGALQLSRIMHPASTSALLQRLEERERFISEVSEAWDLIPTKVFGNHDHQAGFLRTAVCEGLFRSLVITLETRSTTSTFLLNAGLKNSVTQLRNHRQVLQHWTSSFRRLAETRTIKDEIEEEDVTKASPKRRHGRRIGINRPDVLREVNERKAVISAAMALRDFIFIRHLIDDLVSFQLGSGEAKHLAKSLCDLALEAKELGMVPLQLELTERSINIAPDDYWSWTQYGDALLSLERIDDALRAYEQSENFGAGVLARTGKGEALKAKGALDKALAAFNDVILEHPDHIVAKTGRAGVLKAQGQLPAALAAFDEIIKEHPENVVAKSGRAEVLKAQGQLPAALAAFDEVIREHPDDVIAKTGRAEVLKAQGQLPAALAAFDEVIREHPENVVAKTGRAEVLKAQGQFPAALAAFDEVTKENPENVIAKTGRAEVLKAQGQFPAALAAFDEVIREHPENVVAKTGRAEALKAQGQFPAALAAFDEVIREHPENVVAKTGRAEALKAQGQFPAALAAFDEVIKEHPEDVFAKIGRAEMLKVEGNLTEAVRAYDDILLRYPHDEVARNGRSCVLATLGRYDEALESLPTRRAQTFEDWIGYHIRGMILLRTGKRNEAIRIFQEGAENAPWPTNRDYFITALALAWMRGRDFKRASEALEGVKSAALQPAANVLRIHAFGAQGDRQRATEAYDSLTAIPHLRSNELTLELHHQFIFGQPPRHDEDWINDREAKIVFLAA